MTKVGILKMEYLVLLVIVLREVSADSLGNFWDVSWRLPEPKGVPGSACEKDLQDLYTNLRNMTLWANEMWDSSGRGPSGLLEGSLYQLGNFGECLGENDKTPRETRPGPPRHYCLVQVTMHNRAQEEQHKTFVESFNLSGSAYDKIYYSGNRARLPRNLIHWGVCAPASCRPAELESLLQLHFNEQTEAWNRTGTADPEYQISISSTSCQVLDYDTPFTVGALLFIWLASILTGLALFTTLYHWYLLRRQDREDKNPLIVRIYSIVYNLKQLGKRGESEGLDILWGLRLFSIFIIILDHRFGTIIAGPLSNREFLEEKYNTISSIFYFHGDLMVDSFLVLSGLLSSYGLLKAMQKSATNIPVIIIYRYIRLVPAYAVIIFFTAEILPLTGSGPMWPIIVKPESEFCRQSWWTNILMLSNYVNTDKMCMVQSWYIPCDFHFFLVSLAVCYLFRASCRMLPVLVTLILASVIVPALITYYLQLPGTLLFYNDFLTRPREHSFFLNVYITSHARAGPFMLGVLAGYLITKYRKPGNKQFSTRLCEGVNVADQHICGPSSYKDSDVGLNQHRFAKTLSTIGAVASLGVMFGIFFSGAIFYEPSRPYSAIEASFYAGLHRPMWGAALCVLIICGSFGHIPVLSMVLSQPLWIPLGKLVYGAYLIHMSLQVRAVGISRQPYHMDIFIIFCQVLGDIVISFSIALVLYLIVENPIKQIVYSIITSRSKRKRTPATEEVYSQTGHTNRGMDMDLVTEAVPPISVNKAASYNKACILRMFVNEANTLCEKNKKNIDG